MREEVDICIIGGGVVGMFCALEQVRKGKKVRIIDKLFNGSSRFTIGDIQLQGHNEAIAPFIKFSRKEWHDVARDLGQNLGVEQRGSATLALSDKGAVILENQIAAEHNAGFDGTLLTKATDADAILEKMKITILTEELTAVKFDDEDYVVDTEKAIAGLRKQLIQKGILIWGSDEVTEFIKDDNGKVIGARTKDNDECMAKSFYITTGVWTDRVLRLLNTSLPIRPARMHLMKIMPPGRMPPQILVRNEHYGKIMAKSIASGEVLMAYTGLMDPAQATWDLTPDDKTTNWMRQRGGQMIRSLELGEVRNIKTISIAVTPDNLPYIGKLDGHDNIYIGGGFNGQSYAFAAGVAKYLGQLERGEETAVADDIMHLMRPSKGRFKG